RFSRDWSSDVCSSDLINIQYVKMPTSEAMSQYVEKKLQKIAEKYEWLIRAEISFKLENNVYGKGNICEMELSLPGPKIFATSTEIGRASCREEVNIAT